MTLRRMSFQPGTTSENDIKGEVVLVPSGGAGEGYGNEQRTSLADLVPGTTSRNDLEADLSEQARTPTPIVKWAGGKTRLLPQLLARAPQAFDRYFEPMVGGGALFFALAGAGRVSRGAVLGDANADLIAMYEVVRDNVEALIGLLELYRRDHGETLFYGTRTLFNRHELDPLQRAAAFIYLNKTCFNGLWRVNLSGEFNVPIGDYRHPAIYDADALREASFALAVCSLRAGDFRDCVRDAKAGDFVYFDPPYDGTFNAYTSEGTFDQAELARVALELAGRGCHVMLSNADTPRIRALYASGFTLERVTCKHSINSDGTGRGDVAELVITTKRKAQHRAKRETTMTPDQQYFDGMAPPDEVPEVASAIYAWLDKRHVQKRAADETKMAHAQMLEQLAEHKLDSHPYTDPSSGKRRRVWVKREPKAATTGVRVPKPAGERRRKRGGPRRDIDAEIADHPASFQREDNAIEMRRVPRASVEKEIDPFGAVRGAMAPAGGVLAQAEQARINATPISELERAIASPKKPKSKKPKKSTKRNKAN